jgi:hypothetical protein
MRSAGEGDEAFPGSFRLRRPTATLGGVRIERSRRRREAQPEPTPPEPPVGARRPGVQARRFREPTKLDFDGRLRRSLEARRGISTGATLWRAGSR